MALSTGVTLPPSWLVALPDGQEALCRLATPSDYQQVLELGEVYSGYDYLPDVYLRIIHETTGFPVIVELHGKIVAFRMLVVLEGGRRILGAAARTHPDYRGFQIMTLATTATIKMLRDSKYPELREYVTVTVMVQSLEKLLGQTHIYTLLDKWKWVVVSGTLSSLRRKLRQDPPMPYLESVRRLGTDEAVSLLTSYMNQPGPLSCGHHIVMEPHWVPYSWAVHNIKKATRSCQVFGIKSEHGCCSYSFVTYGNLSNLRALNVIFNYHGRTSVELFCAHLGRAVEEIVKVVPGGDVYFHLHMPGALPTEPLLRAIEKRLGLGVNMPEVYGQSVHDIVLLSQPVGGLFTTDNKAKL